MSAKLTAFLALFAVLDDPAFGSASLLHVGGISIADAYLPTKTGKQKQSGAVWHSLVLDVM
jgi:hypothetical protein